MNELYETARSLVAEGKGILAADESSGTIEKRFAAVGVESSEEQRRSYRELLFTAAGIEASISGVILFDETIRQSAVDGTPLPAVLSSRGLIPGIKVDRGTKALALFEGETVTEGLDGLRERFAEYRTLGARFAKWRATYTVGAGRPSATAAVVNAHALARYAALAQEAGLVPIVEPEVLMDGTHTIEEAEMATGGVLEALYRELSDQRVDLRGTLLKPNMVLSGYGAERRAGVAEVAERTLDCLTRHVPAVVPGIVFLSGGQSDEDATAHLNALNLAGPHPWELSFSFGRALQSAALEAWHGDPAQVGAAQQALAHRARMNGLARSGRYDSSLEHS